MLNEKPSDDFHWKSKLEALESVPGEAFNREAAWGKLHERMQGKPRNKKAIWYWAAAAFLLLALLIPWLFLANKKEGILVKDNPVQKQIQPVPPPLFVKGAEDTGGMSSLSIEKKSPALSADENKKINSSFKHDIIRLTGVQDKKEKEAFTAQEITIREITINTAAPVDTAINIVANIPEKKKLKVVHINDLGDPPAEASNITKSYEQKPYERRSLVKFINQEVNISMPSSGNTGFNIFKTKNIPSN